MDILQPEYHFNSKKCFYYILEVFKEKSCVGNFVPVSDIFVLFAIVVCLLFQLKLITKLNVKVVSSLSCSLLYKTLNKRDFVSDYVKTNIDRGTNKGCSNSFKIIF